MSDRSQVGPGKMAEHKINVFLRLRPTKKGLAPYELVDEGAGVFPASARMQGKAHSDTQDCTGADACTTISL